MKRFNVRVYGICIQEGKILVTDELRSGMKMTKFPGGGLEFGEGLANGLKREWQEELAAEIEVGDIFYVNPFLQISAFCKQDEVMGVYFWVKAKSPLKGIFTDKPMSFVSEENDQQLFRWLDIKALKESDFTFPIDQAVVLKLKQHF